MERDKIIKGYFEYKIKTGITQKEIAKELNMNVATFNRLVNGKKKTYPEQLIKLENFLIEKGVM